MSDPAAPAAPADPAAPAGTLLTSAVDPAAAPAAPAAPVDPAAPPAPVDPAAPPAPAAPVVPEKYEFKAPEGVTLDQAQVDAFTPVAKELGLTNEQAQKLVDLHTAQTTEAAKAFQTSQHEAWQTQVKQWESETRSDKEIGGAKFDENIGLAAKAIDKFGSRELRQALDTSGMGNHPAVVKFFVTVGRQLAEDGMAGGNAGQGGTPKSLAEKLFPDLKPY
jgi:hypothetical protein